MKSTLIRSLTISAAVSVALLPVVALAQRATTTRAVKIDARASTEISNRIDALNTLHDRVSQMKRLDPTFLQSVEDRVKSQIDALTALKTKIDTDTDAQTLKTDAQSITASYRIYALIVPQTRIAAMVDRIKDLASRYTTLGQKLSVRISALPIDTTSLQATLLDYNAKVGDARVTSQAALDATQSLKPDNGDKTLMQGNVAALKQARTNLQAAQKDLHVARQDLETILKGIRSAPKAAATTTVSQ